MRRIHAAARWTAALALGLMSARLHSPATARAAPAPGSGPIAVTAQGCGSLRASEVTRLLKLELRQVTEQIRQGPALRVLLRCEPDRLVIAVEDPITRKRVERDLPALREDPGQERVAALAASQLFSASWLELLMPPPAVDSPPPQPLQPLPPTSAVRAAEHLATERTTPQRAYDLMLGAGVRGRSLQSGAPFAASRLEGLLRVWLAPSVAVVFATGWDFGQTVRGLGQLRAHAVGGAAGLGWRAGPGPTTQVGGHILAGTAYSRICGRPSRSENLGNCTAGATAELLTSVGPRIRAGRFRLDLDLEVGAMLRTPLALVETRQADGRVIQDVPVTLGGLWVGAMLRLGADVRAAR